MVVAFKVIALVVVFDPSAALAFDVPKSSISLALAALSVSLLGILHFQYGRGIYPRTRLHAVVAAFVLANGLSVVFSLDPYTALFGGQRRLGLTFVLDMAVLYLSVAVAYRSMRDWGMLAIAAAAGAVLAMGYGLTQALGLDPIPWTQDTSQRPPSTFGNPDKFGHFLAVVVLSAAGVALVPSHSRRLRVWATALLVAGLGVAAVVATRGTLLGIGATVPILALVALRVRPVPARRAQVLLIGKGLLVACVLGGGVVWVSPLGERLRAGFGDAASQQRILVADAAIRAFVDRPLFGFGVDNFAALYPQYRTFGSVAAGGLVNQDSAHSLPLQTLATTGAFGAAALATLAGASLLVLWRSIPSAPGVAAPILLGAAAYWVQSLVAIGSVSVDWIGWLSAGAAAGHVTRQAELRATRSGRWPYLLAALLSLAAVVLVIPSLQANRDLSVARAARNAGRSDVAIARAASAASLDPGRAEHWFALAQARQDRKQTAAAATAFREAAERAPHFSAYWSNLALALTDLAVAGDSSLGGREAALSAARRGADADPNYPTPHYALAVVANALGEHDLALASALKALRLFKEDPDYSQVAAEAALRMADVSSAVSGLEQVIAEKDSAVARVALARLALRANMRDAARGHAIRALELEPQNIGARELATQLGILHP